jgi:DNA-binding CsgD family transcriptional regulator
MNQPLTDGAFVQRLENLKILADDLPASLIIHQVEDLRIVYMNKTGLDGLGTTLEALQNIDSVQYHVRHFNSEDSDDYVPKVMRLVKSNTNEHVSYFQEVRSPADNGWQLYVSNTKVFARNENGIPTHIITIASLLDPVHHISVKVNRLLEETSFFRNNTSLFLLLTRREREILTWMARGMNSTETAKSLFISPATAETHRRNIRNKLGLKNNYDAIKFAQAFDLVKLVVFLFTGVYAGNNELVRCCCTN